MKKSTEITTTSKGLENELKKKSWVYTIIYTILVCVLAGLLVFNYFMVFTSSFNLSTIDGHYLVGVVSTENYYQTQPGQALKVKRYVSTSEIRLSDELYYSGNAGEGTGIVVGTNYPSGYVVVELDGQTKNISVSTIIGKVVEKQDDWGYVVWFFQSWVGTAVLNGVLLLLIIGRTIWGFSVETSLKGRELQLKLKKQKQQQRKLRKMYKNYQNTGLDADSFELLDGDFEENKINIEQYAKSKDLKNAYKFVLAKVHRVYIGKTKITIQDREKITNCIELMCLAKDFDMDTEYMLTDLILKTHVVGFDLDNFVKTCKDYFANKHTTEDLACFASILYVLVKKNKHLRKEEIYNICEDFDKFLLGLKEDNNLKHLQNLSNYIKKLIKN